MLDGYTENLIQCLEVDFNCPVQMIWPTGEGGVDAREVGCKAVNTKK